MLIAAILRRRSRAASSPFTNVSRSISTSSSVEDAVEHLHFVLGRRRRYGEPGSRLLRIVCLEMTPYSGDELMPDVASPPTGLHRSRCLRRNTPGVRLLLIECSRDVPCDQITHRPRGIGDHFEAGVINRSRRSLIQPVRTRPNDHAWSHYALALPFKFDVRRLSLKRLLMRNAKSAHRHVHDEYTLIFQTRCQRFDQVNPFNPAAVFHRFGTTYCSTESPNWTGISLSAARPEPLKRESGTGAVHATPLRRGFRPAAR